ncbi:hypothetical protein E2C01_079911 [Portunus trituberculatus]|uniref:Uncharacterized protein n=1 Tax=Portunus trituberculatus TaxID=210409 RepID=A0A5B7ISK1_PORTR|nr:hypothetical protein [Portunus trituberculatus]
MYNSHQECNHYHPQYHPPPNLPLVYKLPPFTTTISQLSSPTHSATPATFITIITNLPYHYYTFPYLPSSSLTTSIILLITTVTNNHYYHHRHTCTLVSRTGVCGRPGQVLNGGYDK